MKRLDKLEESLFNIAYNSTYAKETLIKQLIEEITRKKALLKRLQKYIAVQYK